MVKRYLIQRFVLCMGTVLVLFQLAFSAEFESLVLPEISEKMEKEIKKDGRLEKKISGLLQMQVQLKKSYKIQPTPERLNFMNQMGMEVEEIDKQMVFIHVKRKLSPLNIESLRKLGVAVHEDSWIPPLENHPTGFVIANMPVDRLYDLAKKTFVVRLETAEQLLSTNNDEAAKNIYASNVWEDYGYTGSGVRIAVLDSGLDTSHNDIPTPIIGKDYTSNPPDDDIHNPMSDHGTHVTGSVLGRGTLSNGKYKGMAYGADLIFLKIGIDTSANSISTSAMIKAIKATVDTYDADIVTMSAGGLDKYNDGSDEKCQAVDYTFSKGTVVFISAGNEADKNKHYSGIVTANSMTDFIKVNIDITSKTQVYFYLNWFDGKGITKDLDLSLYDSDKTDVSTYLTLNRKQEQESDRGTEVEIFPSNSIYVNNSTTLYLKVKNYSKTDQFFHIYSTDSDITFEDADPNYTVGSPAVADNAIAVGSYVTRKSWTNYKGDNWSTRKITIGDISPFSSRGPRIDDRKKPDISAPGQKVISARDKIVSWPGDNDGYIIDNNGTNDGNGPADYYVNQGTSMACPIASGAAALLMQAKPSLKGNTESVRDALLQAASNNGEQNNTDGYGHLNVLAALSYVTGATPTTTTVPTTTTSSTTTTIPEPMMCEPKVMTVSKSALKLKRKKSYDVTVKLTGDNNCLVEGKEVVVEINKSGKKRISVLPTSGVTNANGEITFTIKTKKTPGRSKITFKLGSLKKNLIVEVKA
jgi:subtilisin family serine protease